MVQKSSSSSANGVSARPAEELVEGLPAPVSAYIRATNKGDLAALIETFVDDALVNDQLCDYWGKGEITAWAKRDVMEDQLRLTVVKTVLHYGHSIVTAHVDGTFDKRGLPSPLVLAFYFSSSGDKIVQLIILRNQNGA